MLDFLATVSNAHRQQVAADLGWFTLVQAPPFVMQFVQADASLDGLR